MASGEKEREMLGGGRERGGVGEGEKPKVEGRTEGKMIRAKMLVDGEGPRMDERTGMRKAK